MTATEINAIMEKYALDAMPKVLDPPNMLCDAWCVEAADGSLFCVPPFVAERLCIVELVLKLASKCCELGIDDGDINGHFCVKMRDHEGKCFVSKEGRSLLKALALAYAAVKKKGDG